MQKSLSLFFSGWAVGLSCSFIIFSDPKFTKYVLNIVPHDVRKGTGFVLFQTYTVQKSISTISMKLTPTVFPGAVSSGLNMVFL